MNKQIVFFGGSYWWGDRGPVLEGGGLYCKVGGIFIGGEGGGLYWREKVSTGGGSVLGRGLYWRKVIL